MVETSILDLVRKAQRISVSTPPQQTKKKRKRGPPPKAKKENRETKERKIIVEKTFKTYVDFESSSCVHKGRQPTVSIEIKGFVSSPRLFNDEVVHPTQDKITRTIGLTNNKNLVIDMRRLFFISYETAFSLASQHLGWVHMRFKKVCVILPPSETLRKILHRAFVDSGYTQRPEWHYVTRARDVASIMET